MTTHPRQRGVTLIELLVALAVSAVVLVGIVSVGRAQQKAYYDGARIRAAQASARSALLYLEQKVSQAGYGMAPSLAFDFDRSGGPCPTEVASGGTCLRDRTDDSDELVFYARNPSYWVDPTGATTPAGHAWYATGLSSTTLTVNARDGQVFRAGQVLQIVCKSAYQYAYATVSTRAAAPSGGGSTQITLQTASAADPFRRQDAATDGCFTDGTARVFQVDRFRLHVRPVDQGSGLKDPYLVLDQGIDLAGSTSVDEADEQLVAEGIESMQVAFVLANGTEVGSTPGTPITFAGGFPGTAAANTITTLQFPGPAPTAGESIYAPTSWYRYYMGPPADPARLTNHQANIRAVRISLVARSPSPDRTAPTTPPFLKLNQNAVPSWISSPDGYQRVSFETTIPLPNMLLQGMVYF